MLSFIPRFALRTCLTISLACRHLYALYCLLQREINEGTLDPSPDDPPPSSAFSSTDSSAGSPSTSPDSPSYIASADPANHDHNGADTNTTKKRKPKMPAIFTDPGYALLSTSILSTSNCGNPALRLFGFGPVAADGYGIGYIIKDEGISV